MHLSPYVRGQGAQEMPDQEAGCLPRGHAAQAGGSDTRPSESTDLHGSARLRLLRADHDAWRRPCARRSGSRRSRRHDGWSFLARYGADLACVCKLISPISSKSSVPPLACSKQPRRICVAPLNAPRSCPNSSDSCSDSGIPAQLMATKRAAPALPTGVNRARDQLFSSAALARDTHPRPHSPARAGLDAPARAWAGSCPRSHQDRAFGERTLQATHVDHQLAPFTCAMHREQQAVAIERFGDVVVSASAHRETAVSISRCAVTTMIGNSASRARRCWMTLMARDFA